MDNPLDPTLLSRGLIFYLFLVASVGIHEWAHAFTADKLGDPTPASQGRVTLNPAAHMDLIGTVLFPLLCIFVLPGNFFFGWGKPVMINTSYFKHRVRDDVLTTVAGPASNLALALLAAIIGGLAMRFFDPQLGSLVVQFISLNVLLAVFNMMPLPPLDGGHVMRHVVGMSEETFFSLSRWSFIILIVVINIPAVRMALGVVMAIVATPFLLLLGRLAG